MKKVWLFSKPLSFLTFAKSFHYSIIQEPKPKPPNPLDNIKNPNDMVGFTNIFNEKATRTCEMPSANGHCSAR